MPLPNNFKLPKLPQGWSYVNEDEPPDTPTPLSGGEAKSQVGSVLREMFGPQKPEAPAPSLLQDVILPTAKSAVKMAVPYDDPVGLGLMLASTILTGPAAPGVKILGKVGGKLVGSAAEAAGSTGMRRLLSMTGAGAALGSMTGQGMVAGGLQGLIGQLGGEGARKLSQFARMNAQANRLAQEDPVKLGTVVSQIIPDLGSMRSPKDFHAAFKKGAAQLAVSDAYAKGAADVSAEVGQTPIMSAVMRELRGTPAMATSGPLIPPGVAGQGAFQALGGSQQPYSFDDVMETIKRLRTVGYSADEANRGLNAKVARDRAADLEKELFASIGPAAAEKVQKVNGMYARGQRIIDFLDDKNLMDSKGNLNIVKLQQKFKQEGYNVRQSFQLAADAADLEQALFRGEPGMREDIPNVPGAFGEHMRFHFGILPTTYGNLPKVGKYAGTELPGMTGFQGSVVGQLLRRGIAGGPANTLRGEEE